MSTTETFHGYIETTRDSLLIFEACRQGLLPRVGRRLQEKERQLVKSGAVFCFDENESGIKRWTDGLVWSPSRILGNFLVYRELDKRASTSTNNDDTKAASACFGQNNLCMNRSEHQRERALVGSLTSSYRFKRNGLIKKSMSLVVDGVQQHLISYYTKEDVLASQLPTPSKVPHLAALDISPELLVRQNFRIPLFLDTDASVEVRMLARQSQDANRRYLPSDEMLDDPPQPNSGRTRRRYTSLSYHLPFRRNSISPAGRERSPSIEPVLSSSSSSSSRTNVNNNDTCICGGRRRVETRPYRTMPLDMPLPSHHLSNTSRHNSSNSDGKGLSGFARPEPEQYDISQPVPALDYHLYKNNGSISSESPSQEDMTFLNTIEMPVMRSASPLKPSKVRLSDPHQIIAAGSQQQQDEPQRKSQQQEQQQQQHEHEQLHSLQEPQQKQHVDLTSMPTYHSSAASSFYPNQPMMLMGQLGHHQTRDQNPHQHLFSSTSFHSINHSAVPMRTDIIANAFMFDPAALLGSGWNEFEMQL
ncbi:Gti1/Pac2 family-domain-containing protein [Syncephalastrum racemosum]|uniref:Gti1/Pac2 family-domain-containing protein n=1 Tax=Syncephalastrum racemosum TaxID=13706 RepID=A0A1X2H8M9_SYNRA|nr:Gti1/Pac2 family-domain-containing protein [Syncephalastrum racemosum]